MRIDKTTRMSIGMGIIFGVALGLVFDNIGLGLALGIVFGGAYAYRVSKKKKNK